MNWELLDVRTGFRKGSGTRDQLSNIHWTTEKAREFQENINFCFIYYTKVFDCVDHNKLWKILKEMGIPDHLTFLQKNLYAGQEAPVRTRNGTMDWFQIGKGVCQICILSPCLFNLYAEYIRASLIAQLVKNMPAMQETPVQFLGWKIYWRRDRLPTPVFLGSLVAQLVKNLPAMRETWVWFLGWEDPLEKGEATHSSILVWRIPWTV